MLTPDQLLLYPRYEEPIKTELTEFDERFAATGLIEFIEKNSPLESAQNKERQSRVLSELCHFVSEWIKQVGVEKGMSEEIAVEAGGNVSTSGSYRLGINESGADIDALCLAPKHCDRNDFFTSLKARLSVHPEVSDLIPVQDAQVPIMKFKWSGVEFDLLFASLPQTCVPKDFGTADLLKDSVLSGLTMDAVHSLNGPRVTNLLVSLVPHLDNFKLALRAVRYWARRRAIFSNKIGFLGGVNWAILVAFVCQLFPAATPAGLFYRFFLVYCEWQDKWSKKEIRLCQPHEDPNLRLPQWSRLNHRDRDHVMPIITPAYPNSNSSYNVSISTLQIMNDEFNRAKRICTDIKDGRSKWDVLFETSDFFARYSLYLAVDATAADEADRQSWVGWAESRLRLLVQALQNHASERLTRIHPHPEKFPIPDGYRHYIGLEVAASGSVLQLGVPINEFKQIVNGYRNFREGMTINVQPFRWTQLPEICFKSLGGKDIARGLRPKRPKRSLDGDSNPSAPKTPEPPATRKKLEVDSGSKGGTGSPATSASGVVTAAAGNAPTSSAQPLAASTECPSVSGGDDELALSDLSATVIPGLQQDARTAPSIPIVLRLR